MEKRGTRYQNSPHTNRESQRERASQTSSSTISCSKTTIGEVAMIDHFGLVQLLTTEPVTPDRRLNDFAVELGWRPSDSLELPTASSFATGHLVVEHGLDYAAVITFLQRPNRFID